MIRFHYPGPAPALANRKLLLLPVGEFHAQALRKMERPAPGGDSWTLELSENLFFDEGGLGLLAQAVRGYTGKASTLSFRLKLSDAAYRPYYSLGQDRQADGTIALPVKAQREQGGEGEETLTISFQNPLTEFLRFPDSLAPSETLETPLQLLSVYHCEHDLLFANQILVLAYLARKAKASPRAWLGLVTQRHLKSPAKRVAMAYKEIHPSAQVHPTAVIEGSSIGAGSVVGAHCVVRCSAVGRNVQLRDGAKVEFSVVGDGSCLMHDLALLRCHVEDEVFLIHGPYQFSLFQSHSSAFATIMMDYRADGKPIKVATPGGTREYQGRFLGAVLKEYAKSLGGSLLAPGIVVPEKAWLSAELSQVHKTPSGQLESFKALPPSSLAGARACPEKERP
jgi:hypothetical protein